MHKTNFFILPPEIRLLIYHELFSSNFSINLRYNSRALPSIQHIFPAICFASKQLYFETIPNYMQAGKTHLYIEDTETPFVLLDWLARFGDEAFKAVLQLHIKDWPSPDHARRELVSLISRSLNAQNVVFTFFGKPQDYGVVGESHESDGTPYLMSLRNKAWRLDDLLDEAGLLVLLDMKNLKYVAFGWWDQSARRYVLHHLGPILLGWIRVQYRSNQRIPVIYLPRRRSRKRRKVKDDGAIIWMEQFERLDGR